MSGDYGEPGNRDGLASGLSTGDIVAISVAGGAVATALVAFCYYLWCPESPRFDRKPWTPEWRRRTAYHARHWQR